MKDRDQISEVYRKQVEGIIDNQTDYDLFPQLTQNEEEEIWEEISEEMDIDEVWTNISYRLDADVADIQDSGVIVKTVAVFIALLMGLIPARKVIPDSAINLRENLTEIAVDKLPAEENGEESLRNYNTGKTDKEHLPLSVNKDYPDNINAVSIHPEETQESGLIRDKSTVTIEESVSSYMTDYEKDKAYLTIPQAENDLIRYEITSTLMPAEIKVVQLLPCEEPGKLIIYDHYLSDAHYASFLNDRKGFSFGLITSLRNTWLLNQETLDGLKSESLNATEVVFFPDLGLSINYSLNNKWMLQADGFISSSAGQEYFDYIYGHYSKKKVTLNYSTVNLSVKHKFGLSDNQAPHISVNVAGGFYFSFLHYVYQKINNDLEDIGSQFRKNDYGITCGAEFEVYLFDRVSVSPGIKFSVGLPNIYKGDNLIPGYLRRTQNGSAEFCLALYYHYH